MATNRKHKHLRWKPAGPWSAGENELPVHDPPLAPHDEAVFLLHVAAEVEHALMVQYLYAAYSLDLQGNYTAEQKARVQAWRRTLLGIAREEMGHLVTVQNLLRLIGAPIILEREDYPFRGELYPFHFRLEPLSKRSLAKYVVAEMPQIDPPPEVQEIIQRAANANTLPINRVGAIYARISHLFSPSSDAHAEHLTDHDILSRVGPHQAHYEEWGDGPAVQVPYIGDRYDALEAIRDLAEQGEGLSDSPKTLSHYQRFLNIYKEFPEEGDWQPAHPVPMDPNTSPVAEQGRDPEVDGGRISHPRSRMWAQLANIRYRLLLAYQSHFLESRGPLLNSTCDYTPRGLLNKWTFDEMRRVGQLAAKLATMPRLEGEPERPERAGAPFEMPYTLALPEHEPDRWRRHLDVLETSLGLMRRMSDDPQNAEEPLLREIAESDMMARQIMQAVAAGDMLPEQLGGFKKVVRILEDSVRGFRIGVHHNFWRGCTRDEFVNMSIFGNPLIARRADGAFDPAGSNLIKALRGEQPFNGEPGGFPQMPAKHPPVRPEGIEYICQWIEAGCPDSEPLGEMGMEGMRNA
ncbi:MAG: ferritin-like domain-containing protein [Chloroflexia bacterium]